MNNEGRLPLLKTLAKCAISSTNQYEKQARDLKIRDGAARGEAIKINRQLIIDADKQLEAAMEALLKFDKNDSDFRPRERDDLIDTCAEICWAAQTRCREEKLTMALEDRKLTSMIVSRQLEEHTLDGVRFGIHAAIVADDLLVIRSLREWQTFFEDLVNKLYSECE